MTVARRRGVGFYSVLYCSTYTVRLPVRLRVRLPFFYLLYCCGLNVQSSASLPSLHCFLSCRLLAASSFSSRLLAVASNILLRAKIAIFIPKLDGATSYRTKARCARAMQPSVTSEQLSERDASLCIPLEQLSKREGYTHHLTTPLCGLIILSSKSQLYLTNKLISITIYVLMSILQITMLS